METILVFSAITIAVLFLIIKASKSVIYDVYMDKWCKIIDLAISHSIIYCLLQYACGLLDLINSKDIHIKIHFVF